MTSATAASLGIDRAVDVALRLRDLDDVEAVAEVKREISSRLSWRVVEIEYHRRDVIDLEGRRIAEQQHLNDRRHDQPEAAPFVAPELDELLDQDTIDACEHGCSIEALAEGARRENHDRKRIDEKEQDRRGQRDDARAFQKDGLDDGDVVSRVDEIGDRLDDRRHLVDGKDVAGQQRASGSIVSSRAIWLAPSWLRIKTESR